MEVSYKFTKKHFLLINVNYTSRGNVLYHHVKLGPSGNTRTEQLQNEVSYIKPKCFGVNRYMLLSVSKKRYVTKQYLSFFGKKGHVTIHYFCNINIPLFTTKKTLHCKQKLNRTVFLE